MIVMNRSPQKLPIGIQGFESLRNDGYLYVDKTRQIYELINTGRYYFLSRPRRFGKSLLISTIRCYYEGKRELFDGLYIGTQEHEWKKHPVLFLDLNTEKYDSPESLTNVLNEMLTKWESLYGREEAEVGLGRRFQGVIQRAHELTGQRTVILVDEYDKPMLQAIGNPELQAEYRAMLKSFYGALKSMDEHIKFAMLTGVTKFGKVSVFSDLNSLNDISMWDKYYDICGINEQEMLQYFSDHIALLAESCGLSRDECVGRLRDNYDGYHFLPSVPGLYNPFSLLITFAKREFGDYWFETGTPTYLVTLLRAHDYNLEQMANSVTDADVLNCVDADSSNPLPVIYQSGYLTIKGYDPEFKLYTLGFPNKEVEQGFMKFLVPFYSGIDRTQSSFAVSQFVRDVESGEVDAFLNRLKSFFADTPYELVKNTENHYQNVLYIISRLAGFYVKAEYHTSQGRIDMVLQTVKHTYVMEFKLNGTAEEALQQIKDKQYDQPYRADCGRDLILIGLNFSATTRNIDRYVVEVV